MRPAMNGLIAGFDAGQTHTTCRLVAAQSGALLAEGQGPGVCHLAAPGGSSRFVAALQSSLNAARSQMAVEHANAPLLAAAVGASGIEQGTAVQQQGLELAASSLALPTSRLTVTGDERTALRGAFPDQAGIVVISGTGTIAVGRSADGREHRCGGWGWLLDGAGSAMDIGRDALALSLQMADRRRVETPLRQELWQALGMDPVDPQAPQRIKALVVNPDFGPAGFAALAPVVEQRAGGGDGEAEAILQANAAALVAMVVAIADALALEAPAVSPMGGALQHLPQFLQYFATDLATALPKSQLRAPEGDACAGAICLARALAASATT